MPRGMSNVVENVMNRVRDIYFKCLLYFQKRKRSQSPVVNSESESDGEKTPPVKKFRIAQEKKRKRSQSPVVISSESESDCEKTPPVKKFSIAEENKRKRKLVSILKKPIVIPSGSESDASVISVSSVKSDDEEDEEPPKKMFRICEEENEFEQFVRDPNDYNDMFEKEIKTMRVTKSPQKEPFKVFFPRKRKELLHKLSDDRYGKDKRRYVAKRLEAHVNNHNRVKKLNSGNSEPLLPEEETVFDVEKMLEVSPKCEVTWVAPIPESDRVPTPFDQPPCADYEPGEDCTDDDDEFRFNDASTHEGHLRQNGELTWFCNETIIMMS